MRTGGDRCPACSAPLTVGARFCANCGVRLEAREAPPTTRPRPAVALSEASWYVGTRRRLVGAVPLAALVLACLLVAPALVAFVGGDWPLGLVALGVSAALIALFVEAARRDPTRRFVQAPVAAYDRARDVARYVGETAVVWSEAERRRLALRLELRALRARRRHEQYALGEAAYRDAAAEIESLRAAMRATDEAIGEREREAADARERARRYLGRAGKVSRPTESLPVLEIALVADTEPMSPAPAAAGLERFDGGEPLTGVR